MNESENIIVILTNELLIGATIVPVANQPITPIYEDTILQSQLEQFLKYLEDHNPSLTIRSMKEDGTSYTGLREVTNDDPDYFTAFVEEGNRQGLIVVVLYNSVYELLKPLLPHLSVEDRKKVFDQIVIMSPEEALQFTKDFQEAFSLGKESL